MQSPGWPAKRGNSAKESLPETDFISMIQYLRFIILLLTFGIISAGCERARVVTQPAAEYESLGTLEVKTPVKRCLFRYATLGLMSKHSHRALAKKLTKELARKARKDYGADAVANVTVWPEENAEAEVAFKYARGEMIRYKKFSSA